MFAIRNDTVVVAAMIVALIGCGSSMHNSTHSVAQILSPVNEVVASTFSGTWVLQAARSTAIDPWRNLSLEIDVEGDNVSLRRHWRGSREGGAYIDSVRIEVGGDAVKVEMEQWADNRHLGAYIGGDRTKTVTARWADGGETLITESAVTLSVQQGETPVRIYTEYRLSSGGDRLDVLELRSTRSLPIHYLFNRAETDQ